MLFFSLLLGYQYFLSFAKDRRVSPFNKNSHLYLCFLSSEDFAEEFRRKGIVFNRALEDLEDRAKKCESLKILVSQGARDAHAQL